MVRAPFYDKNGLKKGAWSAEEDEKLRSYIQRFGHWNWREIPKYAGNYRMPLLMYYLLQSIEKVLRKSCRLRWMNYLRPEVKHGNFTEEEDDLILKLHREYGNRWSMIAASLPGRTDNEIKNQWHSRLKARANENPTSSTDQSEGESMSTHRFNGEAESICIDIPPNMILESSALSPRVTTSSTVEVSSSNITLETLALSPRVTTSSTVEVSSSNITLETLALSPMTPSTFQLSPVSLIFDGVYTPSLNVGGGGMENVCVPSCSSGLYEDRSGGDFWSEPFVAEKDLPPPYEIHGDKYSMDLIFYQMMHGDQLKFFP